MRIGQLFLPEGNYLSGQRGKVLITDLVRPSQEAGPTTPYLLYEVPVRLPRFACFVFAPTATGGEFSATMMDISANLEGAALPKEGVVLEGSTVWNEPPLCWQLLLKNAASELQPLLKPKADFAELADVWINQPRVYDTYIDRRKGPGIINRQNTFMIMAWDLWKALGLSIKERVFDMENQGYGSLTTKAFIKRAQRLGLPD